ncbi:MAG TPA: hypothetical protein PK953_12135, partial [Smithellaceae bacterium]|nr:hypothetical protein [Smithellaceae bacterium]
MYDSGVLRARGATFINNKWRRPSNRCAIEEKVMNVAVVLIIAVVLFFLAYRFYARFIAKLF